MGTGKNSSAGIPYWDWSNPAQYRELAPAQVVGGLAFVAIAAGGEHT